MFFIPPTFIPEYPAARKHSILSLRGWWLNRWPILGWLETFVKIAAWFFVPYVKLDGAIKLTDYKQMTPEFAIETIIMFVATGLITLAVLDRLRYREIISIIFVFPNNWAHWTVTMAMFRYGREGINTRYMRIFCLLMFAGDIAKLLFFTFHDFSLLNIGRFVLYALVAFFALLYLVVLLLDYGYFSDTHLLTKASSLVIPFLV